LTDRHVQLRLDPPAIVAGKETAGRIAMHWSIRLGAGWLAMGLLAATPVAAQKTLIFGSDADLKVLDPVANTISMTQMHGLMIYDVLYAFDDKWEPRPQMAESHTVSGDGLAYTIRLRPGLAFHDGTPVRAADAVASLRRWSQRDVNGRAMAAQGLTLTAVDERTFTIALRDKWGMVLDSIGKPGTQFPFIMREKDAATDPATPITEAVGSGPFRFVASEWVPGHKVVYQRNAAYMPRSEPASLYAGGKVAKVDRVEWRIIPDMNTALAALNAGEIDFVDNLSLDLLPVVRRNPDVVVRMRNTGGAFAILRTNTLLPPFDNEKARQALLHIVDQQDYMRAAIGGDESNWKVCWAWMVCSSPMGSEAGAEGLRKPDLARARQLLAEAGYKGEPVTVLYPMDQQVLRDISEVTVQRLKQVGVNVDVQAGDWATLSARRAKKDPPAQGGWNIFHTWVIGHDFANALTNYALAAPCDRSGWFGWICDNEIEQLRKAWMQETDLGPRRAIAEAMQRRAVRTVPYIPLGQFQAPQAHRKNVEGLLWVPLAAFWNADKRS
jgi:peptide/nickel transport system substrate-binding protein